MSPSSWLQELASPITCAQRSIKWFFERRWRITASDVPKIFGRSQYGNAANVLQDKLNPQPAQPTAAQQRGIDGEERAVQAFLRSHVARQLAIVDCIEIGLLVHPGAPWLAASSDRVLTLRDGRKMLLEVKCYGQHPGDALPEAVRLQVEVQLGVAQAYGLFDTPGGSPTEPTAYVCIVNSSSFEPFGIWSVQHSAAAALDRHNHHVDHIVSHQLLDFDESHTFSCLSVTNGALGVVYGGCLGELSCSCPYEGVCKHLQAAARLRPLTHGLRMEAAQYIAEQQAVQLQDPAKGVAVYTSAWGLDTGYKKTLAMNIYDGYCECLDYASNAVCAHLLAADQLFGEQYGHLFKWSTAVSAPADLTAAIPVQRVIPAPQLPDGVQEPTARFDAKQLTQRLAMAAAETRSGMGSSRGLGEAQKKASSLASSTARLLQCLPDDLVSKHMGALEQLHAAVAADVPAYKKHTVQSKKQWRRQDHHRKNRPLFPGRGGSREAAAPGLAVMKKVCKKKKKSKDAPGKFVKQREVGRPRTKYRGLPNLVRGPNRGKGAGGLRVPRKNPHLPFPSPAVAAKQGQQQQQQEGSQRASKRRKPSQQQGS